MESGYFQTKWVYFQTNPPGLFLDDRNPVPIGDLFLVQCALYIQCMCMGYFQTNRVYFQSNVRAVCYFQAIFSAYAVIFRCIHPIRFQKQPHFQHRKCRIDSVYQLYRDPIFRMIGHLGFSLFLGSTVALSRYRNIFAGSVGISIYLSYYML